MREVTIEDGRVVTHGPERPADTDYTVFVEVSRLLLPRLAEWSEPTQLKVDREEGRVAVLLLRTPERPSEVESLRSRLATAEAERDRLREALNPARLRNTANFLRNLADRRLRWWESAQAETRREADYLDTIADAATRRAPSTGGTP